MNFSLGMCSPDVHSHYHSSLGWPRTVPVPDCLPDLCSIEFVIFLVQRMIDETLAGIKMHSYSLFPYVCLSTSVLAPWGRKSDKGHCARWPCWEKQSTWPWASQWLTKEGNPIRVHPTLSVSLRVNHFLKRSKVLLWKPVCKMKTSFVCFLQTWELSNFRWSQWKLCKYIPCKMHAEQAWCLYELIERRKDFEFSTLST